jgi:hypothetical protein
MLVTFSLPEFNLKKQTYSCRAFHVDDRSESSSKNDMIIGNQPRSPWRIRHNHELQWPYSHLGYWQYFNQRQRYSTLSSIEALIEVYMSANEPQTLRDEYSWATKSLDAEYKHILASLDDVIKTCENLHVEEHNIINSKYYSKNMKIFLMQH